MYTVATLHARIVVVVLAGLRICLAIPCVAANSADSAIVVPLVITIDSEYQINVVVESHVVGVIVVIRTALPIP